MRTIRCQVYLHCVWATWDRLPLITPSIERAIYPALLEKAKTLKCRPLAIGGMPDHIHMIVTLHSTVAIAGLLKELKGASSHLATHVIAPREFFRWQRVRAFSVSWREVAEARRYVEQQRERHSAGTLRREWEEISGQGGGRPGD
jgi:REP element-mobilizing transposase RayT